jgi:dephospho-CoA kinase
VLSCFQPERDANAIKHGYIETSLGIISKVYRSFQLYAIPLFILTQWRIHLETVIQIHLPPHNARAVILRKSSRTLSDISASRQEQVFNDPLAGLARCRTS